ncbi:MAG: TonB-dependent receptor plug domain-containing protein [Gemmatimonadales bacterium]
MVAGCAHGGGSYEGAAPPPDHSTIVTSEDLERSPTESIEKTLMSKVPGIWVTRTSDGGIAIRIRGTSSLMGNTDPLYIIDDVPINPGPNGALTGINPHDIASIEVVKDATGTAMYGVRGANGVIIIKTKHVSQ